MGARSGSFLFARSIAISSRRRFAFFFSGLQDVNVRLDDTAVPKRLAKKFTIIAPGNTRIESTGFCKKSYEFCQFSSRLLCNKNHV